MQGDHLRYVTLRYGTVDVSVPGRIGGELNIPLHAVTLVGVRDELGVASQVQRSGDVGVGEAALTAARGLGEVHEVDPLDPALPDDEADPESQVGGGQVHEAEPGDGAELLDQNLRVRLQDKWPT